MVFTCSHVYHIALGGNSGKILSLIGWPPLATWNSHFAILRLAFILCKISAVDLWT